MSDDNPTQLGESSSVAVYAAPSPRVIVVTGLSGSGKSTAIHALEDVGYFCIDNLPEPLLPKVIELGTTESGSLQSLAFVIDTRAHEFLDETGDILAHLRDEGVSVRITFLEADEDVLVRRYSETRRRHPMAGEGTVRDGIRREREKLSDLRQRADEVIDTTNETVHTLKALIQDRYAESDQPGLHLTILSFGFKHGLPVECDLVFDVRFLPNPYFVEGLRAHTGQEGEVADYVLGFPEAIRFLSLFQEMAEFTLPLYEREGKSYLTIGIGCTGGHHRSVAISEAIGERLAARGWSLEVRHRDIDDASPQ